MELFADQFGCIRYADVYEIMIIVGDYDNVQKIKDKDPKAFSKDFAII